MEISKTLNNSFPTTNATANILEESTASVFRSTSKPEVEVTGLSKMLVIRQHSTPQFKFLPM